jgi:hypothetical protein
MKISDFQLNKTAVIARSAPRMRGGYDAATPVENKSLTTHEENWVLRLFKTEVASSFSVPYSGTIPRNDRYLIFLQG